MPSRKHPVLLTRGDEPSWHRTATATAPYTVVTLHNEGGSGNALRADYGTPYRQSQARVHTRLSFAGSIRPGRATEIYQVLVAGAAGVCRRLELPLCFVSDNARTPRLIAGSPHQGFPEAHHVPVELFGLVTHAADACPSPAVA